ncbi:MAG: glyoxalase [Bacteroidetes bacterium]|jgi:hypothetical protein|nr:glyoxalase [Bacteroidota bacterium]MDA0879165.1 glyoxalase [Bacteroidota bacterium]MDA1115629.1 glyoxalase [Bacteroidota bacterium]
MMKDRDQILMSLRPTISRINLEKISQPEESFQNHTLRPILKLQQDVIIELVKSYLHQHKAKYAVMPLHEKIKFIESVLQKDLKLKSTLQGIVIGQFTLLELKEFNSNSQNLSKRIIILLQQRIIDSVMLLEDLQY